MRKKTRIVDVLTVIVLFLIAALIVYVLAFSGKTEKASGSAQESSSGFTSIDQMQEEKIGVMMGSVYETLVADMLPDAEISFFDKASDMALAVKSGKIAGFSCSEAQAKSLIAENPGLTALDTGERTDISFAFQKNSNGAALCEQFNAYLAGIKANGTLDRFEARWMNADGEQKLDDVTLTGTNGTLRMATAGTTEPYSFMIDGALCGLDIELARGFCQSCGYGLEIDVMDFGAMIPALASSTYDFAGSNITVTAERAESVTFSDSYHQNKIMMVVMGDAAAVQPSAASYNGKKIGIITGTSFEAPSLELFPYSEHLYFNSESDVIEALAQGKIDGFLDDLPLVKMLHQERPELSYLDEILVEDNYAFAFRKNDPRGDVIREQFNEYLADILADGTMAAMDEKWFSDDEDAKVVDLTGFSGENGELNVVTTSTNIPFSYIKDGKMVGLAIEMTEQFCRRYGYTPVIADADYNARIPGLVSGKYDMCASSMSITEERKESINFSEPYYEGGIVLTVRTADLTGEATKMTCADFNGKKAGIITGSMHDDVIRKNLPDSPMLEYNSFPDMTIALLAGHIDYYLQGRESIEALINENDELSYIEEPLDQLEIGAMFPKTDKGDQIRAQFDEFLNGLKADGTLDEIFSYWSDPDIGAACVDTDTLTGENGTLVFATSCDAVPYTYIADGKYAGIEPDLAVRFCEAYGYKIKMETVNTAGLIPGLKTGIYDFSMACIVITEERKETINFSVPYAYGDIMIVARKSDIEKGAVAEEASAGFLTGIRDSFEKNFIREQRWKLIVEGIGVTCLITVLSALLGSLLAFLVCMYRRTGSKLANLVSNAYVKLLQGTPIVVLLMILYYVIFGKSGIEAIWVAVIGFSLNFGAYASEIMRSGIESIDGGQREAALAIGYSENQAFFRFIFPQAAVRFLPVYNGEIVSLLKSTSIVGYIAIQDLTKMSDIIRSRTYEAFFPLIATALIYFLLAWIISLLMKLVLQCIDKRSRKRRAAK